MFLKFLLFTILCNIIQRSTANVCAPLDNDYNLRNTPYLQRLTENFNHGEEPTWYPELQLLYFVDLFRGLVNSYDPVTHELNSVYVGNYAVTPVITTNVSNHFVVGVNNALARMVWDGRNCTPESLEIFATVDQTKPGNRFNDGKADKLGRLWVGTMGYENSSGVIPDQGSLYRFNKSDPSVALPEIRPVSISNGLAWNHDNTKFYYIDTPTRKVVTYDFDLAAGTIKYKEVAFDLENYDIGGNPDGMTIDCEGNLFVALYGGGAVIKVNPTTHELLQTIAIPAQHVTSTMFGGKDLDILFVTTSRQNLSPEQLASQPHAGSLFAITNLKTHGRPVFNTNIF